jgi:hypothetical protein
MTFLIIMTVCIVAGAISAAGLIASSAAVEIAVEDASTTGAIEV